jgi:ribonuclease HI
MQENQIIIFTDGSSRGNPGPGGWGAIIVYDDKKIKELGGREDFTTNNRMELRAVIGALSFLQNQSSTLDLKKGRTLILYSDSAYVINGITKWVFGWQKNGWVTATKNPVENQDLWQELFSLTKNFKINWQRVDGHMGVPGNERCDEIATSFADNNPTSLFDGEFKDYSIKNILDIEKSGSVSKKNSGGKTKRGVAYSYVSLVDGVISIDKTWAECERRVKGKKAKYKKALSKEDEEGIVSSFKTNVL